jgi:hypothetical protein
MDNETKEWEVANFHGQTSVAYAYVWMVPGSLFLVLSKKINYLAPFKHKHKQQKFAHEN